MTPAIKIEQVHKQFGALHALRGVDLTIEQGEFFALLGPNGAGKSTLINLLAGLLRPSSGNLSVMGNDVMAQYRQARHALGVVPQELVFDPFFNVREMLRFQAGYFGKGPENDPWIDEVIESLGLTDKVNTNMRRLSGGMKRRALIAQALVHKPPVIVLDEPTAGVDVELRYMLWEFIKRLNREGHTIILTTHYLEEAEALCSRVALLKQGEVIALDSTKNLLASMPGKKLRLKLASELPPSLIGMVRHQETQDYTLSLNAINQVEYVLAELRSANVAVEDMQLIEPDLEDVFVDLMGRA
ncbi:ABC transporter ATP-binding protein [Candidatus Methylopumilus turicensis]|uniref:Putative transporter subunit: ATP-binding component of ABC superfamily n=1 Tax=Candidatus Methylopumilus turicensis TaxID=1581680 RepID=A0A0B7ISL8_9PROT|nr:ABC transporter ATP-binding protein [Candidatus Methylopumilus turicensis]CEN55248.1 putative transporter subunit: ATP-binding component of ABC superfamily [Candidatus Methylopumilus turicensis]